MNEADHSSAAGGPKPPVWRGVAVGVLTVAAIIGGGIGIYRLERPAELAEAAGQPERPEVTPVVLDSAVPAPLPDASAPAADASNAAPDAEPSPEPSPVVDDTITRMEQRLKDEPEDVQGWRMLGWAYFQNARYKDAARALRKATALDPDHAESFSFLGEALVMASRREGQMPRGARIAFDKALAIDPKNARARYFKALSLDLAGKHRRALRAWFAQLSETPPDAPYASDIRSVIRSVGKRHHIEVEKRLAIADAQARLPKVDKDKTKEKGKGKGKGKGKDRDGGKDADRRKGALPGPAHAELKTASGAQTGAVDSSARDAMARGMVDGLEARLARNPGNVDGWILLIRSRVQQDRRDDAAKALAKGLAAFKTQPANAQKLRDAAARLGIAAD
ncbi:cytochrome c-type biogenesis protein CcmH [Novosphingobium sp. 1529]|uniref:tetratricopeptide repeat protein n=1 Tax=Novosphingobium sp. 1529 TaxID=3156424 RepID=UPI003398FEA9